MTLKRIDVEGMERKAEAPSAPRKPARAHRGTRVKIWRNGQERTPDVVPTERDRENFDLLRPEEVEQGYQIRWRENRDA